MKALPFIRRNRLDLAVGILLSAVTCIVVIDTIRSIPREPMPTDVITSCLPNSHHADTQCHWVNGQLVHIGLEYYTYEHQFASFVETRRIVCAALLLPWFAFVLWQWRRHRSRAHHTDQVKE